MSFTRVQTVSEELAENLKPCPSCHAQPTILKMMVRENGGFPSPKIQLQCECPLEQGERWYDSLYEACAVWTMNAALLGNPEKESEPNDVPF